MPLLSAVPYTCVEEAFINADFATNNVVPINEIEKIRIVEVQNIYELGKLVALSFIEWIKANPTGVVALPTGKTPEYFIKTLNIYRSNWADPKVKKDMKQHGLSCYDDDHFPKTENLKFVMLDEFFPMLPSHRNSFCNYIRTYYTGPLGIKAENILDFDLLARKIISREEMDYFTNDIVVDLSLLARDPVDEEETKHKNILLKVQAYCEQYEAEVKAMGGIGFFLGGIGPDGHIAFNQEGSDHDSRTRLVSFNYPSAAAAAGDLGGIEIASKKAAMTIGLSTITMRPDVKAVIMAAGEGKADVVKAAVEASSSTVRPASVLHTASHSIFYLTHGAASKLVRKIDHRMKLATPDCVDWVLAHQKVFSMEEPPSSYLILEAFLHDTSLHVKMPLHQLQVMHLQSMSGAEYLPIWLQDSQLHPLCLYASQRLQMKISQGLTASCPKKQTFMHTAPHHDDIMLSYHAAMHYMLGRQPVPSDADDHHSMIDDASDSLGEHHNSNTNYFAYLTSGFHSVNDAFLKSKVQLVLADGYINNAVSRGDLIISYDDLLKRFHHAFHQHDTATMHDVENIIFLRKVVEVYGLNASDAQICSDLTSHVHHLQADYLAYHQPGDAVSKELQLLKGCMRESEVDRVWALSNMSTDRINHLRSKFYNDDFFTPLPSLEDDALPMANLIGKTQPDVLTVAFDPEGTGPDTHYKVLQLVAAALRIEVERGDIKQEEMMVWGYRNVWFTFTPANATLMIPASKDDLDLMHDTFMHCFTTQATASFPSPHYEGPFSAWARHIQQQQRQMLGVLLGEEYFMQHDDVRMHDCKGFIFIRAMPLSHFLDEVEELKSKFQNN